MLQQIGLVALGGSIGASLRYTISSWITYDSFPIATISVNVIGSFILGIVALSVSQSLITTELALFLGVGIVGSFTTMSAFSVETIEMLQDGNTSSAGIYIILTFALCPILAWLGWIIGDKLLIS
jgi:CrcB protein